MTTGEMIKYLLENQGKTQVQLSKYLSKATGKDVSPNTVNRWIPNDSNPDKKVYPPSRKFLPLIADFLKVSVDVLLCETGEYGSKIQMDWTKEKNQKWTAFENLLQSFGYEIENDSFHQDTNTIETPTEYLLKWDGEERYIKAVDLDLLLKKLEKHIKIEIEDYY